MPMFALAQQSNVLVTQPPRILFSGVVTGALSVLAYGLMLWAQATGALAPIAAPPETNVIIGALVFRGPFGRTRIAATILVVAGMLLLNLGWRATSWLSGGDLGSERGRCRLPGGPITAGCGGCSAVPSGQGPGARCRVPPRAAGAAGPAGPAALKAVGHSKVVTALTSV